MLCESNGIYINHTLLEVLHYDFLFSIQGGGHGCFFQMSASEIQRRSCLKSWDKESMAKAIKAVRKKEMGYLEAAKLPNVPRSALCDYVRSNLDPFPATQSDLGRKLIIPPALEEKLVEYLLFIERKYFGCTRDDVRRLAFQSAVQNKIPNLFSIAKQAAGKDWFKRFMK